jgi:hypothetical protein
MTAPANGNMLLAGEDGGYQISKSVRFRPSATAYLTRTPASATNRSTWTYSAWIKKSPVDHNQSMTLLSAGSFGSDLFTIQITDNGLSVPCVAVYGQIGGSAVLNIAETAARRDPSAWFHLMVVLDTTQATASNRVKIYYNGSQVTALTTATYPNQNTTFAINNNQATAIGARAGGGAPYYDGYMAEVHFVDGQALTPTSFGETDTISGVWNPKKYAGTYGTNGFYLKFDDTSSFGKDSSGNSNTFTSTGISNTAGSTYDSMVDSPTNYGTDTGVGGEVRGNYAVVSPVTGYAYASSNGNLTTYGGNTNCYFSMPITGKMYFEAYCTSMAGGGQMGFVKNASISTQSVGYTQSGYYGVNYATGAVTYWVNAVNDGINHGTVTNQTMKFAVDGATGKVWIGSGSTWFGSGDPANGTNPAFTLSLSSGDLIFPMITSQSATYTFTINTGQTAFANAAPSGFKAMCTQNMTTPSISKGGEHMSNLLWQGTGNTGRVFTGVGFKPDLVWAKDRSAAYGHVLFDSVRGAGGNKELGSQSTGAEGYAATSSYDYLSSFDTDGFTSTWSGSNSAAYFNTNTHNYVAWNWKANGSTVSNTNGSVNSTVSANTTAGFSIATFTPPASGVFTFGHGLGIAPNMVIFKDRNTAGAWAVYHSSIGNTAAVFLNTAGGISTSSGYFNNTSPTSTVVTGNVGGVCTGSSPTVAYSFAAIKGYSAFGSYIGTGQPDGAFAYCGFRPRFVMIKAAISGTGDWFIFDAARDPYNWAYHEIYPDAGAAENSSSGVNSMDILSNGFKMRTTSADRNASGVTFIYAAFAENPFNISRAR